LSTSIWVYGCNHKEYLRNYYNSRYHNKCFEENGHNGASYMWSKKSCAERGIRGRVTNNLLSFFFFEGFWNFEQVPLTNTILVNIWQHCKHILWNFWLNKTWINRKFVMCQKKIYYKLVRYANLYMQKMMIFTKDI